MDILTKTLHLSLFGFLFFCTVACSEDGKEGIVEHTVASVIQSNDWRDLHVDIHEIHCFGRNILEADLTADGSEITVKILYRRNHSISLGDVPDSVIDTYKKAFGPEFDEVLFDTIVYMHKDELDKSITWAYKNRESQEMTPAGYALEVDVINGEDTVSCKARNAGFINIFKNVE